MKINNILFLCCITLFNTLTYTMNEEELKILIQGKQNNHLHLKTIQDIPELSFQNIKTCFEKLPNTTRINLSTTINQHNILLSDSLTFNIAMLPTQAVHNILSFMLNHDEIATEKFYKTPLWYAVKRYNDAYNMMQKSALKHKPTGLLFRLPLKQQKEIMEIMSPSSFAKILYGNIVIDKKEKKIIMQYNPEIRNNFFAHEDIALLKDRDALSQGCCITGACVTTCGTITSGGGAAFTGWMTQVCCNVNCSTCLWLQCILIPAGLSCFLSSCIFPVTFCTLARCLPEKVDLQAKPDEFL